MPDVLSWVSSRWSPLRTPAQPLRKPAISNPCALMPRRTTARITALRPGQSPPPVRMPMRATGAIYSTPGGRAGTRISRAGRRPAQASASRSEILRIGRAAERRRGDRNPGGDAGPDVAEPDPQDVGAVPGAVHPCAHDRRRRREPAAAPGEVLAQEPPAGARQVAGAREPAPPP